MSSSDIRIRLALPADATTIAAIYNQGIRDRIATLETEERTPDERAAWLARAMSVTPSSSPSWTAQ